MIKDFGLARDGKNFLSNRSPAPQATTPAIDVFSDFSITENKKAGTLNISGKLTGDNYPSTEAFISDPSGNNLFMGVGQIGKNVGVNTGPFTELWGEGKDNPITSFNFTVTTDKKGILQEFRWAIKNIHLMNGTSNFLISLPNNNKNTLHENLCSIHTNITFDCVGNFSFTWCIIGFCKPRSINRDTRSPSFICNSYPTVALQ